MEQVSEAPTFLGVSCAKTKFNIKIEGNRNLIILVFGESTRRQ